MLTIGIEFAVFLLVVAAIGCAYAYLRRRDLDIYLMVQWQNLVRPLRRYLNRRRY